MQIPVKAIGLREHSQQLRVFGCRGQGFFPFIDSQFCLSRVLPQCPRRFCLRDRCSRYQQSRIWLSRPVGEADPDTRITALQALPNVHLMGLQPYADLPAWLAHADVALLPLQENTYTQHMFPMKFFEYLAAGRPVVATRIPALRPYASGALLCPPDAEAFDAAIATALSGDGPPLQQRLALAAEHTYESRTRKMLADLQREGLLDAASNGRSMLRAQARTWPLQRLLMPALFRSVRLRNFCGRSEAGRQLLGWIDGHHPVEPGVLDAQIPRLIQKGLYTEALALMERSWLELGRNNHLNHLLFRRGARPKVLEEQIALFETLGSSTSLPFSYRAYCRVVCAYRAAEAKDPKPRDRRYASANEATHDLTLVPKA